jgi:hypothetical protein
LKKNTIIKYDFVLFCFACLFTPDPLHLRNLEQRDESGNLSWITSLFLDCCSKREIWFPLSRCKYQWRNFSFSQKVANSSLPHWWGGRRTAH